MDQEPKGHRAGDESAAEQPATVRPGRRRRMLAVSAVLVIAGVYVLPWVIAATPLVSSLASQALPGIAGKLTVGRAKLDWFSYPQLFDVRLSSLEGEPLVVADRVQIDRSLWSLMTSQQDLGKIQIDELAVQVRVEEQTTDLERVLGPWLNQESTAPVPNFALLVKQTQIQVSSGDLEQQLNQVATEVEHVDGLWKVNLSQPEDGLQMDWEGTLAEGGQGKIEIGRLNLQWITLLSPRFGIDAQAGGEGSLAGDLKLNADGQIGDLQLTRFELRGSEFMWPQYLGTDRVVLDLATLSGGCSWSGTRFNFRPTELKSSIGGGQVVGYVDFSRLDAWWLDESGDSFESSGEIVLGPLSRMLPQTLRMREDVAIGDGTLAWTVHSRAEADRRRMLIDLTTTPLTFRSGTTDLRWESPCRIATAVVGESQGPALEFLSVQAPDLSLEGAGTLEAGELKLIGDLAGWERQFGQLVDLQGMTLAGRVNGTLAWGPGRELRVDGTVGTASEQGVGFGGRIDLTGIDVQGPAGPIWQDPAIEIGFGGRFDPAVNWVSGLKPFWATVVAAQDVLTIVPEGAQSQSGQARLRLEGSLGRWLARLGMSELMPGHQVNGTLIAEGTLAWDDTALAFQQIAYRCNQFALVGPDLNIVEPEVAGVLEARYGWQDGVIEILSADGASSAASIRLGKFRFGSTPEDPVQGDYAIRADLSRLMSWFPAWRSAGLTMTGEYVGTGAIRQVTGERAVRWGFEQKGTVERWTLSFVGPDGRPAAANPNAPDPSRWSEALLNVDLQGTYDPANGRLALARGELSGDAQAMSLAGTINLGDGRWPSDLQGALTVRRHDWVALLRPWIGEDAELVGEHSTEMLARGPLILGTNPESGDLQGRWPPKALRSSASIAWDSGQMVGIPFGPGELKGNLAERVLDLGDFQLALGSGNLRLKSRISFERPEPRYIVDAGRVLEGVELTPEACRQWLMFAAPLAANATAARGSVDLDVSAIDMPLYDPLQGTGAGVLHVHQASIGPGPIIEQVVGLVRAVRSLGDGKPPAAGTDQWVQLPEQQISFRMEAGRVFHERLEARFGDVALVTRGSVGRDQSIDLVATIPIQDSWVAAKPLLAPLKGLQIEVPIRGTLTRPQVDTQVLAQLSRQLVEQAAGRLIDEQIQRGLGRLFGNGN